MGLVLSLLFPKKSSLDTLGERGNPHPLAGLLGTLSVIFTVALPGLFLLLTSTSRHPVLWLGGGLTLWAGICGFAGDRLRRWAESLLFKRREFLYEISQGR